MTDITRKKTYVCLGQHFVVNQNVSCQHVRIPLVFKLRISERHGFLKILGIHSLGAFLGFGHSLHQRLSNNLVLRDGDERSFSLGSGIEDCLDSLHTLQGSKHSIVCHGGTTSLDMSKGGDAGVEGETTFGLVGKEILDFCSSDLGAVLVASAFGHNDDSLALANFTVLYYVSVCSTCTSMEFC